MNFHQGFNSPMEGRVPDESSSFLDNRLPPLRNASSSSQKLPSISSVMSFLWTPTPVLAVENPREEKVEQEGEEEVEPLKRQIRAFEIYRHYRLLHPETSNQRFEILEQPNPFQRKSFSRETRYVTPNPIIVRARPPQVGEEVVKIEEGTVTVQLVALDGRPLPPQARASLQCKDGAQKAIDEVTCAPFILLLSQTSEGEKWRLLFTVRFKVRGSYFEERIVSDAFKVDTNTSVSNKRKPAVFGINEDYGLCNVPNEIWIRGRNFSSSVTVLFGKKEATIMDREENLLRVVVPLLPGLEETRTVRVTVANKYNKETYCADRKPLYTYIYPN